jgi:bifunctional DNA-binding transcriptional regulator/antitoxin component of YhaV-PrlF toxin-antitoxin module
MQKRTMLRRVKARELSAALRRRLRLKPGDEVDLMVTKRTEAQKKTARKKEKDPWLSIKGTLTAEEAEEMRRVIHESRRSKLEPPDVDVP